jgi:thiamine pyrophosphokinase
MTFDFEKFSQVMTAKGLPIKNAKLDQERRKLRLKTMRSINERWNHNKLSTKK